MFEAADPDLGGHFAEEGVQLGEGSGVLLMHHRGFQFLQKHHYDGYLQSVFFGIVGNALIHRICTFTVLFTLLEFLKYDCEIMLSVFCNYKHMKITS